MTTKVTERPARFLGSCRACKRAGLPHGVRVETTLRVTRVESPRRGLGGVALTPHLRVTRHALVEAHWVLLGDKGGLGHTHACGRGMLLSLLVGTHSEKKCGARCLASTGPSCECSCGGANHGTNH